MEQTQTPDSTLKSILTSINGLDENSTLIEVGGYKGTFIDAALIHWGCKIIAYEPVKEFYKNLVQKYAQDDRVAVRDYGLWDKPALKPIYIKGSNTSVFEELTEDGEKAEAILVTASNELKKYDKIDMLALNCEGSEYCIIQNLITSGIIKKLGFLLVQYHKMENSTEDIQSLEASLTQSHDAVWTRGHYIWVLYKRNSEL